MRGAFYSACLVFAHIEVNQWFNCRQRRPIGLKWSWTSARGPNGDMEKQQGANKHDYNTLGYSIYTNKPLRPSPAVKSTDLIFALRGGFSRNTVQLTILCTMKVMPHK